MGIFTKDVKVKDVTPKVTKTARNQMEAFLRQYPMGTVPDIPTRQIAGQTALQQDISRMAGQQITGPDYGISADAFRTAAQKDTDVMTSPEFTAARRLAEQMKTEQQTGIRQRAELGGQLKSTPAMAVEAEAGREFDTALLQEFARMERQAEQDKLSAAAGLTQLGTQRLGQMEAVNRIADQERAIEQARNDAVYQQAISTVLFPYQEQLQLYTLATGQQPHMMKTGGGLTDLGFYMTLASDAAKQAASGGAGG